MDNITKVLLSITTVALVATAGGQRREHGQGDRRGGLCVLRVAERCAEGLSPWLP